jgi:hypothetical protein
VSPKVNFSVESEGFCEAGGMRSRVGTAVRGLVETGLN